MFHAAQIRIARPTSNLKAITRFYHEGLGMEILGTFQGHRGYDGVMLGMPDKSVHLEFTSQEGQNQSDLPTPTKEHLLVLYFNQSDVYQNAVSGLLQMGCIPVAAENPYWTGKSETFEDPDGWRVVLFDGLF